MVVVNGGMKAGTKKDYRFFPSLTPPIIIFPPLSGKRGEKVLERLKLLSPTKKIWLSTTSIPYDFFL